MVKSLWGFEVSSRRRARRSRGREAKGGVSRFVSSYNWLAPLVILAGLVVIGAYLRLLPAINYGLELDANDPWIAYWIARYFKEEGLFSFSGLERVKLFWWPVGRDLLRGEYIGTSWLAAATHPIASLFGLDLKEWLALIPVIAGVLNIVVVYLLVVELSGSRIGGIVSAMIFSLAPGAISRTLAGFVEKTGIALPIITTHYLFLAKMVNSQARGLYRRSIAYAILSGVFGGMVAFFWGGHHLVALSTSLVILLDPLLGRPSLQRLRNYALVAVSFMAVVSLAPAVGPSYFIQSLGVSLPASLVLYAALYLALYKSPFAADLRASYKPLYLWLLATGAVGAILMAFSGVISLPGRMLLALGIRHFSPLAESIQEHSSVSLSTIISDYGVGLLLYLVALAIASYRILWLRRSSRHDVVITAILVMSAILVYANKQLAYFTQAASYYVSIAAGLGIAEVASIVGLERGSRLGPSLGDSELRKVVALGIIVLVVLSGTYFIYNSYRVTAYRAPAILTSGLPSFVTQQGDIVVPLNDAWIRALEYIKENTSEDALIVSWWDYGYWITVNTGRRTVADGATINETQIRLLARILTGNENEASYLLRLLGAEPNNTYIVFYESLLGVYDKNQSVVFLYFRPSISNVESIRSAFITHGMADFPKSFQMLKIGRRIDPFAPSPFNTAYSSEVVEAGYRYFHFPGFTGQPAENVSRVLNALIYGLGVQGIYDLKDKGIFGSGCNFINGTETFIPGVVSSSRPSPRVQPLFIVEGFHRFKPEAIVMSCPYSVDRGDRIELQAVVVYIYKWLG